jgi:hypothetical protein
MNNQKNDTRLSPRALQAVVDYAYGGAAVRAGRKAQARTLARLFRGKRNAKRKAARNAAA